MLKSLTIIIPYYNGEKFYAKLLKSIKTAILKLNNKNELKFEIITIIDSINTPLNEIREINNFIFREVDNIDILIHKNDQNIGVAASRNIALDLSTGEYIHIIDQDDEVDSSFYLDAFKLLINSDFVLTNGFIIYDGGKYRSHKLYYFSPKLSTQGILEDDFIRSPGQVVFSKSLLNGIRFPETKNYKGTDDRFFWIKIFVDNMSIIRPSYVAQPNYVAHIHNSNYSNDLINMKKSELENWELFNLDTIPLGFRRIVNDDILRIKLTLGENMTLIDKLRAIRCKINYFLKPNKLLRFILKRSKC